MPEVVRIPVRLDCAGIDLTHPVDRMPPATFPLLSNIRTVEEGRIESRPGYGLYDASASAPKLLHSIRRLNDPDESFAPAGYVNVVGNGTIIEAGVENTLTQIDSGYSGNPLSLITFRPEQSPESWMYAYDQNKQIKVRPDGVTRPIGVAPPNKGPSIDYGPPANVDIAAAQNDTGWSYSGAFGTQDRTASSSPVIDAILYNFGSTGWCCIAVTITNGYNFQWAASRMKILLGGAAGGVGTVNTSGTGVTFETGVPFNTGWTGSIVINGVSYPISSVGSTTSITLSGATANDTAAVLAGDLFFFNRTGAATDISFLTFSGYVPCEVPVQFRSTANVTATAGGQVTIPLSIPLNSSSGQSLNLSGPIVAGQTVTGIGSHRAGCLFPSESFFLAMPRLPSYSPFVSSEHMNEEVGVSMRTAYGPLGVGSNQFKMGSDVLCGATMCQDYGMRLCFPIAS